MNSTKNKNQDKPKKEKKSDAPGPGTYKEIELNKYTRATKHKQCQPTLVKQNHLGLY